MIPPGISTSIETSPERNIIAPASDVNVSPASSATTTAGACPSRTVAFMASLAFQLVEACTRLLVDGTPARFGIGLVDGRLPVLEGVALVDERARLLELRTQHVCGIRRWRRLGLPPQPSPHRQCTHCASQP